VSLLVAVVIMLGSSAASPVPPARVSRRFDADVARALRTFQVPGAAIAVVKDGKVLFMKGYGVRRWGEQARVDPHTLFQIASNTKAFTTACLALLADSGTVAWDDRVTKFLPWFELADPWVTREFTVRDLVTHRSGLGLGAGDLLWLHSDYSRMEILRRLRAARPVTSFRSAYAYDNVLYAAAGEVVAAATGKSWDAFVRERLLFPLGMTETRLGVADLRSGDPLAVPHAAIDGQVQVVPLDTVDNIAPAASLVSSVSDLSKWLLVQLDSGRTGGGRLWSADATREMWSAQTIIPIDEPQPPLAALRANFAAYGLGWRLRDYRGHKVVWHTGGLSGMTSRTTLVPDQRLGVVILTNGESDMPDALTYELLDSFLAVPATDWIAAFRAVADHDRAQADSVMRVAGRGRDSASGPSLPLTRYAGRYRDALYGDASVAVEQGTLVLRFVHSPAFTGDLEHWQHDTFRTHWRAANLAEAYVTFHLNPDGSIAEFVMDAVSPLADFSYDYPDLRFVPAGGRR
jgi:CubicO group peptidase (beta-lactamase class C family)